MISKILGKNLGVL